MHKGHIGGRLSLSHTAELQLCKALISLHQVLKHRLNSISQLGKCGIFCKGGAKRKEWEFLIALSQKAPFFQCCKSVTAWSFAKSQVPSASSCFQGSWKPPQLLKAAWWVLLWRTSHMLPPALAKMGREEQMTGGRWSSNKLSEWLTAAERSYFSQRKKKTVLPEMHFTCFVKISTSFFSVK